MLHQLPREILVSQINNGLIIMLLGMGVVFVFLVLLVFTTKLLSFLVRRYLPEKPQVISNASSTPLVGASAEAEGAQIAAAITAAVAQSSKN